MRPALCVLPLLLFSLLLITCKKGDNDIPGLRSVTYHDGTGRVKIYELMGGQWEEIQELRPGRPGDTFGFAIDINGEHLMIGAYANVYAGSLEGQVHTPNLHFYKKEAGNWISTGFFLWEVDFGSDGYSGPIALQGNYAYARSHWREGLDVYHFDGTEWHFKEKWLAAGLKPSKTAV